MLLQQQSLEKLRDRFHLNIYEAKIWTSLLSRGIAAASELADISGVPRSRCYDVLESLEKKGFIIMKVGKPIKYIAVQPEAVVERVKKRVQEEADQQIKVVEELGETEMFKELELLHSAGIKKINPEEITDSIIGRNNINRFIKHMILRSSKSVTILTNDEGLRHKLKVLRKARFHLAKKNLTVQLHVNTKDDLKVDMSNVAVKRTDYDARVVMVDNEEVCFVIEGQTPEFDSAVWIKSPYFVSTIQSLFENTN